MSRYNWDKSKWGTQVIATVEAVKGYVLKSGQQGILLAQDGNFVKVVPEGTTTASIYWKGFWRDA